MFFFWNLLHFSFTWPTFQKSIKWKYIQISKYIYQHAEVTSTRTSLSPFTKETRGAASWMRLLLLSASIFGVHFKKLLVLIKSRFLAGSISHFTRIKMENDTLLHFGGMFFTINSYLMNKGLFCCGTRRYKILTSSN